MLVTGDILRQLNDCASVARFVSGQLRAMPAPELLEARVGFPMFFDDDAGHPLVSRMTVYGDTEAWAIIIEDVCYSARRSEGEEVSNTLWCYGNAIVQRPGSVKEASVLFPVPNPANDSVFLLGEYVRPEASSIKIGLQTFPVLTDPATYARADVALSEADRICGHELIRALIGLYPDARKALLATEEHLRSRLARPLPSLLSLDEWNHPSGGQWPGNHTTFKMIAEVLVSGDTSLYRPTLKPNTHWRAAKAL